MISLLFFAALAFAAAVSAGWWCPSPPPWLAPPAVAFRPWSRRWLLRRLAPAAALLWPLLLSALVWLWFLLYAT